ncbi:MAG TPA: ATP-binding protein [Anaerolineae bacterium]|nr:ATP-binding protein [Anaerolineae bacterium]
MVDERRLTIPGRFESLAHISDFIVQAARAAGFDEDGVFHVQMAVDEACSNVIEHAYAGGGAGEIELTCVCDADGELRIDIRDHGRPFNPDDVPARSVRNGLADLDEMKVGGLGLFFMRKLMDEVTFRFDPKTGNHLTMIKRRSA